jgi:hypothetical protein
METRRTKTAVPLVWAAYVLGHHPMSLWRWQCAQWAVRRDVAEGRIRVAAAPLSEIDELADAIELLARHRLVDPLCAARLARAAAGWKHGFKEMLSELRSPWSGESNIDWDNELPEEVRHFNTLSQAAPRVFARDAHLELWRRLGEKLCELQSCGTYLRNQDARDLCRLLTGLNRSNDYSFVEGLCRAIGGAPRLDPGTDARLSDPIFKRITVDRVEAALRADLEEEACPEPWISITTECVRFFNKECPLDAFRPAEVRILWVICNRPRERLPVETLIREANLGCKPYDVKSHISRLREILRTARQHPLPGKLICPPLRRDCFIKGHRHTYELQLDATRISLASKRPW